MRFGKGEVVVGIWTMMFGLMGLWRMSRNKDKRPFCVLVGLLCVSGAALVILTRA
jgi:hypothetical protein